MGCAARHPAQMKRDPARSPRRLLQGGDVPGGLALGRHHHHDRPPQPDRLTRPTVLPRGGYVGPALPLTTPRASSGAGCCQGW